MVKMTRAAEAAGTGGLLVTSVSVGRSASPRGVARLARRAVLAGAPLPLLLAVPAPAKDIITYTYDARGRMTHVAHSDTANNGVSADYQYDKADNRTNVTVVAPVAPPPSFAINDAAITEGGDLTFTVTRTGTTSGSFTIQYATADNTATFSGYDYFPKSGTLTFAAGVTSQTVTVPTFVDHVAESTETMFVNLSAASGGATIARSRGIGTLYDNGLASRGVSTILASAGSAHLPRVAANLGAANHAAREIGVIADVGNGSVFAGAVG